MNVFTKWLFQSGYHKYLEITKTFAKQAAVCKEEPKYSNLWYYNKCDEAETTNTFKIKDNLKIKIFEGWIPENRIDENKKYNYETF